MAGPPLGRPVPQHYQASCQPGGRQQPFDQTGFVRLAPPRSRRLAAIFL